MPRYSDIEDYQHEAIDYVRGTPYSTLWMDMGLGKTIVTLTALAELKALGQVKNILVVAPPLVAATNWHTQIDEWDHTREAFRRVNVCIGDADTRKSLLDQDADMHVLSRGSILWMVENYAKNWKWDTLVWDESQSLRNATAKRTKKMMIVTQGQNVWGRGKNKGKIVRRVKPLVKRAVFLTATPATNGLLNVWSQMYCMDGGKSLGYNMKAYTNRYFTQIGDPSHRKWELREPKMEKVIHKKVSGNVMIMRSADHLDMPTLTKTNYKFELPEHAKKLYRLVERHGVGSTENEKDIVAQNGGGISSKLLQITNGACYVGDPEDLDFKEGEWDTIHDAKLDALEELYDSLKDSGPVMVAGWFKHDFIRLKERFPFAERMDKAGKNVARWNNREIPMLFVHPVSDGVGVNLQKGGNKLVFFSMLWDLEAYLQLIGRIWRQGQTEDTVSVIHLVAKGTKEAQAADILKEKNLTQERLLECARS